MQEFLLPAVLTLGHHAPKSLEVLTAITAAELEHLVLGWGHRAGRELCHLHPARAKRKDPFRQMSGHVATYGQGGGLTCQSKTSGLPLKRLWQ